jgi:hypothetical protein
MTPCKCESSGRSGRRGGEDGEALKLVMCAMFIECGECEPSVGETLGGSGCIALRPSPAAGPS